MKKILSPKMHSSGATRLAVKLQGLLATDPEISACAGTTRVYEAWAMAGNQVKLRAEVQLPDGSYRLFTRKVDIALPPEQKIAHRGWTILLRPTWYGFGYQLLDEAETTISESTEDLATATYATEAAQREVNRLLAERILRKFEATAPRKKTAGHRTAR